MNHWRAGADSEHPGSEELEVGRRPTRQHREGALMTLNDSIPSPPEGQDLAKVPLKFEVTRIPVTALNRAKDFYKPRGWKLNTAPQSTEQVRAVQFPPP